MLSAAEESGTAASTPKTAALGKGWTSLDRLSKGLVCPTGRVEAYLMRLEGEREKLEHALLSCTKDLAHERTQVKNLRDELQELKRQCATVHLPSLDCKRREAKIQQRAPDLVKALKHLNVIVDQDRAIDLLRTYSSVDGDLDRSAFSEALAAARVPANLKPPGSQASFTLVAVTDDSVGKELNVSAFVALSLHLRHKVPVVIKGGRRAAGEPEVFVLPRPLRPPSSCLGRD